jgi:archaetidylinositol phosphate synthase
LLTKLKEKVQQILLSEAKAAHRVGLTPNSISVLGFVLSIFSAVIYGIGSGQPSMLFLAFILLLASGFCDTLDGALARNYQQATPFGGFLDSLLDRYSDAIVIAGVIIGGFCDPFSGLAVLIGSLLVSYSRARAEAAGIRMESIGIAERPERVLILAAATLIGIFWLPALEGGIILLAVLTNLTVLQRGIHAYKSLKKM